jgi:hypothetical protein
MQTYTGGINFRQIVKQLNCLAVIIIVIIIITKSALLEKPQILQPLKDFKKGFNEAQVLKSPPVFIVLEYQSNQ